MTVLHRRTHESATHARVLLLYLFLPLYRSRVARARRARTLPGLFEAGDGQTLSALSLSSCPSSSPSSMLDCPRSASLGANSMQFRSAPALSTFARMAQSHAHLWPEPVRDRTQLSSFVDRFPCSSDFYQEYFTDNERAGIGQRLVQEFVPRTCPAAATEPSATSRTSGSCTRSVTVSRARSVRLNGQPLYKKTGCATSDFPIETLVAFEAARPAQRRAPAGAISPKSSRWRTVASKPGLLNRALSDVADHRVAAVRRVGHHTADRAGLLPPSIRPALGPSRTARIIRFRFGAAPIEPSTSDRWRFRNWTTARRRGLVHRRCRAPAAR